MKKKAILIILTIATLSCQTKIVNKNAKMIIDNQDFTYLTILPDYQEKISKISTVETYNKQYNKIFAKSEVLKILYPELIKNENINPLDIKMEIEDTIKKIEKLDPIKDFNGKKITFVPSILEELTKRKKELELLIK